MVNYWELSIALPNIESQEVVNEFLLNLKIANRSAGTVNVYRCFLEKFFIDQTKPYSLLTSDDILSWFHSHQSHVKESTFRLRMSILTSFFTFCVQEEYMERTPMKNRWFPRLPKAMPKYLEKKDIAKTRQQSEKDSLRNRLLVEFLLTSGCRVGEVVALNKEDINLANQTARVVGKGRKIREVHFSQKCALLFEEYLKERWDLSEALFVTVHGARLGIRRIQKILNAIGKEVNLQSSLYPHRLRHTFATELVTKGVELSFISEELGHRNIATTQIYARIPNHELISLYRKYMG